VEYKLFGNTDLLVSTIGFGAWAIGGAAQVGQTAIGWGPADDDQSIQALLAAREAGINFYDTADFYGFGHSESLIGKSFQGDPNIVIATKVGQYKTPADTIGQNYEASYIMDACEASLRRLQRDYIDYYQLHTAQRADLEKGACIEALNTLQKQGKIRYWGVSLLTQDPFPEADWMMANRAGQGVQLVLNVLNQKANPLLKPLQAAGYGIIARMTLQFGLLSGKFKPNTVFDAMDHRSFRLTPDVIAQTMEWLTPFWLMAKKYEVEPARLAMAFVAAHPAISTQIPGMRSVEQVRMNTRPLPVIEKEDLERLYTLAQ
jgi:aryl-alcohol dehydrogenase-like predicted oxidoreductase